MKKLIKEELDSFSPYSFPSSLSEAVKWLKEKEDEHKNGWVKVELYYDANFYYDYDRNPTPTIFIYGYREETDEEFNERLKVEEVRREKLLEQDRARYLELAQKFGKV